MIEEHACVKFRKEISLKHRAVVCLMYQRFYPVCSTGVGVSKMFILWDLLCMDRPKN